MKYDATKKYSTEKYRKAFLKNKRHNKSNKRFLKIVIFIFLSFFLIILLGLRLNPGKNLFKPKKIIIENLTYMNLETFNNLFHLYKANIFSFYKKELKDKIKKLYFVKDVYIKYKFFNIIIIKIEEKRDKFVLYIPSKGLFFNIAEDFTVLKSSTIDDVINNTVISINFDKIPKIGEKLSKNIFKNIFLKKSYQFISEIKVWREKNIQRIKLFINNKDFYVDCGTYLNDLKIENFLKINKLIEKEQKIKYIDLTYPTIGRIIFKEERFNG